MDKPIVVVDTNILVSSIFWSGNPYKIIQKGIDQDIIIFTSVDIIAELKRILGRDFYLKEQEIEDITKTFILFLHLVDVSEQINAVQDDEKDNVILECAVSCNAKYIVSGDAHILKLKEFRGIKILSAREFLKIF